MELSFREYQSLVEQAPIMIWRAGTDMLCDYFNQRWLAFTGRTLEQEQGNGWAEGVHADDLQGCFETYVDSFRQRKIFEMVYRLRRHDGAWRWIFDRGVPFFDADGTFAGYIGSCTDITEKVEAERELAEMHEREIKQLERLLPVCAWCKKIRSDEGYWQEIASYVKAQGLGHVTHGICQGCAAKLCNDAEGIAAERGASAS